MASLLYGVLLTLAVCSPALCYKYTKKSSLEEAGTTFHSRNYSSILTVNNGEQFGDWTWPEMCPDNFFAVGFSIRVEDKQHMGDDTALNGIRLFCANEAKRNFLYSIESHTGFSGDWSQPQYCPEGRLTSFQLRVEPYRGTFVDDTAVNNIKFQCSGNLHMEGPGTDWGEYGPWSRKCVGGGICGIETKMEEKQHGNDDTSLNDARFFCCQHSAVRHE